MFSRAPSISFAVASTFEIGRFLDERLGLRIFDALVRLPLKIRSDGDGLQPLRDLDQVRNFVSGGGPSALFDLPWMPLYLAICFLFHFWIGVTALFGACVLIALTLVTEMRTRAPAKAATGFALTRNALAAAGRRNAEVLRAMGMSGRLAALWSTANRNYLAAHERASDVGSGLGGISKVFRMILQSMVLGVGAYLVIHQRINRRNYHRQLDPDSTRAGAGRTRDRKLERLRDGAGCPAPNR